MRTGEMMFTQANNARKQQLPAPESMLIAFEFMKEMLAEVSGKC